MVSFIESIPLVIAAKKKKTANFFLLQFNRSVQLFTVNIQILVFEDTRNTENTIAVDQWKTEEMMEVKEEAYFFFFCITYQS